MNFKLNKLAQLIFGISILLLSHTLSAQLQVTNATVPPFTPENLIENTFLGSGVEVLNVSYTGDPIAVGYFDGSFSNINIDRGIIMTTGLANNAVGPNNVGNQGNNNAGGIDPDLEAITNDDSNDAAIYNIKFIPTADTLRFKYVLASEEYDEFVCTGFNDAFGFFISGPGIAGPYVNNAVNIALIPGTNIPVTIDNVNNGGGSCGPTNVAYYNNNNGGVTVQYDAFTDVLTATAVVVPCDTYDIKLVIADIGDSDYDSGVFLEAYSFGTNALDFEILTSSVDSTLAEGCNPGTIAFSLTEPADANFPITYTIGGTAINGVDYDFVPPTLFIPVGEDSVALVFNPIEDGLNETLETIIVAIETTPCSVDTVILFIDENNLISPVVDDASICAGDSATLDGTLNITLPTSTTFSTNIPIAIPDNDITNPALSDLTIANVSPAEIGEGSILSLCLDITHPWVSDIDIFLIAPNGQVLEVSTDNGANGMHMTNTCFTLDATAVITGVTAADAPYTGEYLPEGPWSDLDGGPVNGTWTLQVADDSNAFMGTLNSWSLTFPPIYGLSYDWSPPTDITCVDCPVTQVFPSSNTTYTITATDSYGCMTTDDALITIVNDLDPPVITCSSSGATLTFTWGAVPAATGYLVNVDGGGWVNPNNGMLSHDVTGAPGQTFTIQVQGISTSCSAQIGTQTCSLPNCAFQSNLDATMDVSCFGGNDGSFTVSASNGTSPYTFTVGGTTQNNGTFTGLTEGSYTVDISDDLGCFSSLNITLTEPDALVNTLSSTDITCFGANNGTATITVSDGTAPYNYAWSNAAGNVSTINGLAAATYTVTVTDDKGCTLTDMVTINEPPALQISLTASNIACNAGSNGSIDATINGGTASYTYMWSNNASTEDISGLTAGTYILSVTDANNCTETASTTLTAPSPIALSMTTTLASCNGGSDGTATVSASDGTGPYIYLWDATTGNQATSTASNLPFGNYTVTVTDFNGCTATAIANVGQQSSIAYTLSSTPSSCFGSSDGSANANVTAGTPPITYSWNTNPIQNTNTASNIPAGNYTVTITDGTGCSAIDNITVNGPSELILTTSAVDVSCNGDSDGSTTVLVTGGTAPYVYFWDDGQTTQTTVNCPPGFYNVTVTDSNGCQAVATAAVNEPSALTLNLNGNNLTCQGAANGSVNANAGGGIPNYTYLWSNNETTQNISSLGAGIYDLTITDANNCTITSSITLMEPDAIQLSSSATLASCNGGSDGTATVSASGGSGFYTYAWDANTGNQNTATATNLPLGSYSVTVSDPNGCFASTTVNVGEQSSVFFTMSTAPVSCFGSADGTATATVTSGTPPITYTWSTTPIQNTATAIGLIAGNYIVTITDGIGCQVIDNVNVTGPNQILLSASTANVSCNGGANGTATVTASGGNPNYTYQWSDALNQSNQTATGLSAGNYTVTVTDQNGCTEVTNALITAPTVLTSVTSSTNILCNGGSDGTATVTINGGNPGYSIIWSNNEITTSITGLTANTYTLTVTDQNGCITTGSTVVSEPALLSITNITSNNISCTGGNDGSISLTTTGGTAPIQFNINGGPFQTSNSFAGLTAGTYNIISQDASGCQDFTTVTLTAPGPLLVNSTNSTPESCIGNDGTASVIVSGGTGPYTYLWSPSAQVTATASGLSMGNYTVVITDNNGCTVMASQSVGGPTQVSLSTNMVLVNCFGGSDGIAIVSASGGTGGYTYQWDVNTGGQTSAAATGLSAGIYFVTVTDLSSCTAVTQVEVMQPSPLSLSFSSSDAACFGGADGTATVTVAGGTVTYSYLWDAAANNQNTATALGLSAGTYEITVTDNRGCTITGSTTVGQPNSAVNATATSTNTTCNQVPNGTATALPSGGTVGYSYLWNDSNSQTNPTAINLAAGQYTVIVTDANGCFATASTQVTAPPAIVVTASSTPASCFNGMDGTATATAAGGTGTLNYTWSDGQSGATIAGLQGGASYTVTVRDDNGCEETATVLINQPTAISLSFTQQNPGCFGGNDGSATVSASGGTAPYTYQWDAAANGSTTPTAGGLAPGTYAVSVYDTNACLATGTVSLGQNTPLSLTIEGTTILCKGDQTATASVQVQGGATPYQYAWSNGQNTATAINLGAGTYTVQVSDSNGCMSDVSVTITEPTTALSLSSDPEAVTCFGSSNGAVQIFGAGGTTPYRYSIDGINYTSTDYYIALAPGNYVFYVKDANGCEATIPAEVTEPPLLNVDLGADISLEFGDEVALIPLISPFGNHTYTWTASTDEDFLSCADCPAPTSSPDYDMIYELTVENENGCRASDDIRVLVTKERRVFVASGFTPNADGINDFLFVQGGRGTEKVQYLRVYDRWGELVFENREIELNNGLLGWDGTFRGKLMNGGVYTWVAEVRFTDGEVIMYKGDITLVR